MTEHIALNRNHPLNALSIRRDLEEHPDQHRTKYTPYDYATRTLQFAEAILKEHFPQVLKDAPTKERLAILASISTTAKPYIANIKKVDIQKATWREDLAVACEAFNEWYNNQMNDPVMQQIIEAIKQHAIDAKENAVQADSELTRFAAYTFLLQVSGKQVVLVDNVTRFELTESERYNFSKHYTLLSCGDAKNSAANIPYVVTNAKGNDVKASVFQAWLESPLRQDLEGITFDPSTDARIVKKSFNTWRGWAWQPIKSDASLPFWDLVLNVLCNGKEDYYHFVRKYLAHMVQKPWERPLCAIGVSGGQGTGKTSFVKIVGSLVHPSHYNPNVPMAAIAGREMGRDLEGILVAHLDEATWGGNKLDSGELKKAITGESDLINEKYVPKYSVPTYRRSFFSSNDAWYMKVDSDDRRLLPLEVLQDSARPDAFFQSLFNGQDVIPELQQALMYDLVHEDIRDWKPHVALKTLTITTGGSIAEESMDTMNRWLKHSLEDECFEIPGYDQETKKHYVDSITSGFISLHELRESYAFHASHNGFEKNRTTNLRDNANMIKLRALFAQTQKINKEDGHGAKGDIADRKGFFIDWPSQRKNFDALHPKFCHTFAWNQPGYNVLPFPPKTSMKF